MNIDFNNPNQNIKSSFIKEVHILEFENMFIINEGVVRRENWGGDQRWRLKRLMFEAYNNIVNS